MKTSKLKNKARVAALKAYGNEDVEFDVTSKVTLLYDEESSAPVVTGAWVQAWVYVPFNDKPVEEKELPD